MTRRISHILFAGLLIGLSLIGIACGGTKQEETSNAPVGKPPEGSSGPVQAGGAMASEGPTRLSDQGTAVPRK